MTEEDGLQRWQNTTIDSLKLQKAICMLVSGMSVEQTCKSLEISKRTLQRWYGYPEFNTNLVRAIRYVYTSSFAKAVGYAERALDVLIEIIEDIDTPAKHRLEATKILLDYTSKGLPNSVQVQPSEIVQKMRHQASLLQLHDAASLAAQNISESLAKKVTFDNSRAVWEELYPGQMYPES